jgi:hypothetical protein
VPLPALEKVGGSGHDCERRHDRTQKLSVKERDKGRMPDRSPRFRPGRAAGLVPNRGVVDRIGISAMAESIPQTASR